MKKQTRAQKYNDLANAYHQIRSGEPVRRVGRKDGSITVKPFLPITEPQPERIVLLECLKWLRKHRVFCSRHDAGTFQNTRGQWGTYGIKYAGDIIGMLRTGIHFEIECKRNIGGQLSIGQQKRQKQVHDSNGLYFVVCSVQELEHYMEDLI